MEINIDELITSQRGIYIDGKSIEYDKIIAPYLRIIQLQQNEIVTLRKPAKTDKPKKKPRKNKHA